MEDKNAVAELANVARNLLTRLTEIDTELPGSIREAISSKIEYFAAPLDEHQEAALREFRGFQVSDLTEVRCWICGVAKTFGDGNCDAVELDELTAWAHEHKCAPLQII